MPYFGAVTKHHNPTEKVRCWWLLMSILKPNLHDWPVLSQAGPRVWRARLAARPPKNAMNRWPLAARKQNGSDVTQDVSRFRYITSDGQVAGFFKFEAVRVFSAFVWWIVVLCCGRKASGNHVDVDSRLPMKSFQSRLGLRRNSRW